MSNPGDKSRDMSIQSNLPKLDDVISDIARVMEETGLSPADLTVGKYSRAGGNYDGRMLRRMGGFQAIVDDTWGDNIPKDFVTSRYLSNRRAHVSKLERRIGDIEYFNKSLVDSFERILKEVGPFNISKLDKPPLPKKEKKERVNLALISDIHLGLKIDREEVETNAYDWTVGARRLGKFAEQVASYKVDHRSECSHLRVCLGGDLGQGVIHPDYGTDAITYQCFGITQYLISMIDYWRHHYDKVIVEFTPDNHMRMPHRGPDRNFSQKFDSFSMLGIALPLQTAFRSADDVVFHVPKSAITTFDILGHKFGLTHGDTHILSGNVSKTVDVKNIANQILKLNAAQADRRSYDAMLIGHVHTPLFMHLNETQTFLVINGTGSGTDGYAASNSFFRTKPHQLVMEVTKNHAIGDLRMVALDDADTEEKFEKIVPAYKYGLEISKSGINFPNKK